MKVLIATGIFPPDIGGPATYSKLLADEFPQKGIKIEILSFGSVRCFPKIIRHFFYFLKVLKMGRNADIIFAQDPVSVGLPSYLASRILGKKFVLKVVGDYAWEQLVQKSDFIDLEKFQERKFDFLTELRRKIERWVAQGAAKIIVPSEYLKRIVLKWGAEEEKIKVVYNSFEVSAIKISKDEARQKLNLSGFIIISAGRLVPWKGFKTLIEIMPEIAGEIPGAKLLIMGDGPEKENLKTAGNVFLIGQVPHNEMLVYLRAGDIFVLNTGYEGFSHQILETMAMGLPVITTRRGGNPEIIKDRETGLLVEYDNKEEIKRAIKELAEDKNLREKIIFNAEEKVKEFNREKMVSETINFLND